MQTARQSYATAAKAGAIALERLRPGHKGASLLRELAEKFAQPPKREFAQAPKSEWATMKEEVTRKALTAVADAQLRFGDGQINERELWCICDALYDTTSGLVDPDISALIYRARQELKEHAPL